MMSGKIDTARMMAAMLGIDEDEATTKLDRVVLVSCSTELSAWAAEITALVGRTVTATTDVSDDVDLEVVVGDIAPRSRATALFVDIGSDRVVAGSGRPAAPKGVPHPLLLAAAAPLIAALAVRAAVADDRLPASPDPLDVKASEFGIPTIPGDTVFRLDNAVLVGAGAVAHGFLRALRAVPVEGHLDVVDPKQVGAGNLNRCLYLRDGDEGGRKAELLVERAAPDFPRLTLTAVTSDFGAHAKGAPPVPLMIVTVDSPRARRSLQKFIPGRVLDASTTDVREVVVHSHRQPAQGACLACVYRHTPDESAREASIAQALGLDVATVQTMYVTPEVAARIVRHHPGFEPEALVGKAFDTLFRELCASQALTSTEGRQVLTPFAFVSALAGALLVIELVRQQLDLPDTGEWHVDPWRGPVSRTRRPAAKVPDCEVCSKAPFQKAIEQYWGNERV